MSFLNIKGALAKLLATENLHVNHDGTATTASFNPQTRVLTLPILKTEDNHVYDMFVGHEVGHALYTPVDWKDQIDENTPFDFVNVVEDARIEKAIQDKFPGLRVDFSHGYDSLHNQDFFDIADKDVSQLSLIDRINLHFKLGARALIPFNSEEMTYVRSVDEADTFEKVVLVSKMLAEFVKAKRDDQQDTQQQMVAAPGNSEDEDDEVEPQQPKPEADAEDKESAPAAEQQEQSNPEAGDDMQSETQRAMDQNMEDMIDTNQPRVTYIHAPSTELKPYPIEFLREEFESMRLVGDDSHVREQYNAFTNSIKRDVSFMVQQFEMKKSADAYARQQIHKTGVLNTDVLHQYKLTDDIFLRQTVTPHGKNHGLFMLIDWSGSMSDNIMATVKQLLVLVQFCRKVNIPFDVYTFTCSGYSRDEYLDSADGADHLLGEVSLGSAQITHVLSSSQKRREIDADMYNLFCQAFKITYQFRFAPFSNRLQMGGTPLNNVLFGIPKMIEKFKRQNNVQKVSFVCLTDGESSPIHYYDGQYGSRIGVTIAYPYGKMIIRDGHSAYQINTYKETAGIIEYLNQKMPGVSITNIFLSGPKGASSYHRHHTGQNDTDMSKFKKEGSMTFTPKYGWPLICLVNPRSFTDAADEIDCEDGATKAQVKTALKKFLKSKTTSKVLLSSLVSQFS